MKKMISLILVTVLLTASVVTISAYSPYLPGSEEYEKIKAMEAELTPVFSQYFYEQTHDETFSSLGVLNYGTLGDEEEEYVLICFVADSAERKDLMYRIGEFAVVSEYESPLYKDGMAVYTSDDGQWHPLSYIYEKDFDEFWRIVCYHNTPALIGCLPWFVIGKEYYDIRFATTIQKNLAGIDAGVADDMMSYLDVDNDGELSIKDATTVQKIIAGLEYEIYDSIV